MTATVTFRAKIISVYNSNGDGGIAWRELQVPTLKRNHCDMDAFRRHPKFGGFANSNLFPGMLAKIRRDITGNRDGGWLRLDRLPDNVTVDESGFLAKVTITV